MSDKSPPPPIPLRTLTLLLSYEFTTSCPHLNKRKLLNSTATGDKSAKEYLEQISFFEYGGRSNVKSGADVLALKPASVNENEVNFHLFESTEYGISSRPTVELSKNKKAAEDISKLSREERDLIYLSTRNGNGCGPSIVLFEHFFSKFEPNQMISIQLENEPEVLVSCKSTEFQAFLVNNPKSLHAYSWKDSKGRDELKSWGDTERLSHIILKFENPEDAKNPYVVDMTRMQYGKNGRGLWGENYFLGKLGQFHSENEKLCSSMTSTFRGKPDALLDALLDALRSGNIRSRNGSDYIVFEGKFEYHIDPRDLEACADRAMKRWKARVEEKWCEHCGVRINKPQLATCPKCDKCKNARYCCEEHREAGRKLHELTCTKSSSQSMKKKKKKS